MSESQLHQYIGELLADVRALKKQGEATNERFTRIEKHLQCIDQKVTQHRTGWQVFMWLGGVALAIGGIVVGYVARKGG